MGGGWPLQGKMGNIDGILINSRIVPPIPSENCHKHIKIKLENGREVIPNTFGKQFSFGNHVFCQFCKMLLEFLDNLNSKANFSRLIPEHPRIIS